MIFSCQKSQRANQIGRFFKHFNHLKFGFYSFEIVSSEHAAPPSTFTQPNPYDGNVTMNLLDILLRIVIFFLLALCSHTLSFYPLNLYDGWDIQRCIQTDRKPIGIERLKSELNKRPQHNWLFTLHKVTTIRIQSMCSQSHCNKKIKRVMERAKKTKHWNRMLCYAP